VDRERRFILNNRAHLNLLGLEEHSDAWQKIVLDVASSKITTAEIEDINHVLENGVPVFDRECVVVDTNGRRRVNLASKVPLLDADGTTRGIIGISQDITERHQAQEQIQKLASFPQFNQPGV
jgi:PAS domain S-box-containing protein